MSGNFGKWMLHLAFLGVLFGAGAGVGKVWAADEEEESDEGEESITLTIGSDAPAIDVEHWVSDGNGKFKPVTTFEPDKVYVVEFWATWCGPCIASMPHLAEIQKKYASKGVQIISISDEDLETVEGFLKRPVRGSSAAKDEDEETEEAEEAESSKESDDKKDEPKKPAKNTYSKLTSVYCLTTDPDGSVQQDYMRAAGQNGIPTSFIVGKTGKIEWIGHPMSMDEPLEKVVAGEWDRDAFLAEFRVEQEQAILMSKLSSKMQSGDIEGALELLADAKKVAEEASDAASVTRLEELEFQVKMSLVAKQLEGDEADKAVEDLKELGKSVPESLKMRFHVFSIAVLLQKERFDDAATAISDLTSDKDSDSQLLNQVSWTVYEAAKDDDDFSKPLVEAATAAAKKAADEAPENAAVLDTLAHLLHHQGDIKGALDVQTKAVENLGDTPAEAAAEIKAFMKKLKKEAAK